jgi:hypothetical protein
MKQKEVASSPSGSWVNICCLYPFGFCSDIIAHATFPGEKAFPILICTRPTWVSCWITFWFDGPGMGLDLALLPSYPHCCLRHIPLCFPLHRSAVSMVQTWPNKVLTWNFVLLLLNSHIKAMKPLDWEKPREGKKREERAREYRWRPALSGNVPVTQALKSFYA